MSAPRCLFFSRILSALTEVLGRDIRANDPRLGCFFVLEFSSWSGPRWIPSFKRTTLNTPDLGCPLKTIFRRSDQPPVPGTASGGTSRKFGGVRAEVPEGGLNFLEVALVWKFPYGNLPKQSSKKFAPEPPELLRSPPEAVPCGSSLQNCLTPAVESSIAIEDAVENRGLYRVFVSRLFSRDLRNSSATIARLSPLSGLERGGLSNRVFLQSVSTLPP